MTTSATLTGQDIGAAAAATRPLLDRIIDPVGLSFSDWVVLRLLALHGGPVARDTFQAKLASTLRVEPIEAARLIDRASARGHVAATNEVQLSDSGATLYGSLWTQMSALQTQLYGSMDPHDLEVAKRVLVEVTRRADSMLAA